MSIVLPEALVLDCTVTVPWYLTDESSELSEALFHALDSHRLVVPVLGRFFAGSSEAYAYILESLRHYPAQLGVAAKMTELGVDGCA